MRTTNQIRGKIKLENETVKASYFLSGRKKGAPLTDKQKIYFPILAKKFRVPIIIANLYKIEP